MRLLIAAALVLFASSLAMAVPETYQVGPYSVSFDANTNIPYQAQVLEPAVTDGLTTYNLVLSQDDQTGASISIAAFENMTDSTTYMLKNIAGLRMALYGFNATADDRTIDGREGYLVTGTATDGSEMKVFEASYWLDSIDCECGPVSVGQTSVGIRSSFPQDITENILNSLRIAEGATTGAAPAQTTMDMPPLGVTT
ncbi:MAG: hypothetical protein HPY61_13360 [Methanotrichaceae archaeon]|nr:hypothetical protein [Methanotrichaceae archaeon]